MAKEVIIVDNFPAINVLEDSYLTADSAAAQKVVVPANVDGFATTNYCLVGQKGAEASEIAQIDTVVGTNVTFLANLLNKHYRNDPIVKLRANQIKIYRAANVDGSAPADGSFSVLVTLGIEADQLYTQYTDENGGNGYWYKFTYYNSTSGVETAIADAIAVRGGNYGHYIDVDEVRSEAGLDNNRWITDGKIYDKLVAAEAEVNGSLILGGFSLPLVSIPENVKQATRLLAAGFLLTMDYGPEFSGTLKDGERKIKEAREILASIEKGTKPLVDGTGAVVSQSKQVKGYPDDSAPDPMFTSQDRF